SPATMRAPVPLVATRLICCPRRSHGIGAMPPQVPCRKRWPSPPDFTPRGPSRTVWVSILQGPRERAFYLARCNGRSAVQPRSDVARGEQNMPRFARIAAWTTAGLAAAVLVLVTVVAVFDWNRLRPWVEDKASQALQRPVAIEGDLDLAWKHRSGIVPWPHITAEDVT